jgi:hypothetical protein
MHFFGAKKLMGFALAILGECFWEYFLKIIKKVLSFKKMLHYIIM